MSYLDLLVITDPGSARTAQAVIWKHRGKKSPHRTRSAFQLDLKKMQTMKVFLFSLYLARDDISTIWSEKRKHLLENPAANEACYTSKVVFFGGFWEQTFPQRRLMTNELRALTSLLHELSWLNWIPVCLLQLPWFGSKQGKEAFLCLFQSFSKEKHDWWEMQFASLRGKAEWGINTQNLGGEFSSGSVPVRISRSLWSFPSLFFAFPLCYRRKKLELRATAHL